MDRWNQALLLFHDLVKSDSPKEIALVEVQNGSIDVIINVDISVAVDLVVVLTAGYKAFKAFLEYKIKKEEILSAFQGNKELQKLEEKAETLLLDGIGKQVEAKIREIHRDRKKQDSKIRGEGINASIPRISNLLTDQIVKGNEVKLLSSAENHEEDTESEDLANELSENARVVRKLRNSLSVDERRLLTTKYELSDEEK